MCSQKNWGIGSSLTADRARAAEADDLQWKRRNTAWSKNVQTAGLNCEPADPNRIRLSVLNRCIKRAVEVRHDCEPADPNRIRLSVLNRCIKRAVEVRHDWGCEWRMWGF